MRAIWIAGALALMGLFLGIIKQEWFDDKLRVVVAIFLFFGICLCLIMAVFTRPKKTVTKLQCFKDSLMKRCEIGETISKNETLDKYMVDFWREKTLNIIHRGIGKRLEMFDNITQSFNQIVEDLIKNPNSFMPDDKPPKYRKPQLLAYIYNLKGFIKTELKSINDLLPGFECQDLEEFNGEDEKEYRRVIGGLSHDLP